MLDCLELFGDVAAIYPIPPNHYSFAVPFNVIASEITRPQITYKKTVDGTTTTESINIEELRTHVGLVCESYCTNNLPSGTIEIEDGATVKATRKVSTPGVYYEVSVSAKSHDQINKLHKMADDLSSVSYFDCFVVDIDDNIFLLKGAEAATDFSVNTQLPRFKQHEINITIHSINGIQVIKK